MDIYVYDQYAILSILMDRTIQERLSAWLIARLEETRYSYQEVANRAGVSKQVIGKYVNQPPDTLDLNVLLGIAHAFEIRPEKFFRNIGIFPAVPEHVSMLDEWNYIFGELTDDERTDLLDNAHAKIKRRKKVKASDKPTLKPSRNKKPARSALIGQ